MLFFMDVTLMSVLSLVGVLLFMVVFGEDIGDGIMTSMVIISSTKLITLKKVLLTNTKNHLDIKN